MSKPQPVNRPAFSSRESQPGCDSLIALAKCFRVSVDFILGIDGANVRLDRLTEDEAKAVTMLVQAMEKANGSASEP